jgi:hypothetical protein
MSKIIPIIMILVGLFMWRFPARSAFQRRNENGIEIFKSYDRMRARRSFEGLIRIVGAVVLLAGLGHLIVPSEFSLFNLAHPGSASVPGETR